jgi:hypothetical protein
MDDSGACESTELQKDVSTQGSHCQPVSTDLFVQDHDARSAAEHWWDSGKPHAEWPGFLALVREMLLLRSSRRALTAVSGALRENGALDGPEVHRLVSEAVSR